MTETVLPASCVASVPASQCNDTSSGPDLLVVGGLIIVAILAVVIIVAVVRRLARRGKRRP